MSYEIIHGIAAVPGVAIGRAYLHRADRPPIPQKRVSQSRIKAEVGRFEEALLQVAESVARTRLRIEVDQGGELAAIFDAQRAMIEDAQVKDATIDRIRSEHWSAERAFTDTMEKVRRGFEQIENEYLRARVADVYDIEQQVLMQLAGGGFTGLQSVRSATVIVARDLLPSEAAQLARRQVRGLVTDMGGTTSHTAIIARSLGLPTVVGTGTALQTIATGDEIVVDGDQGNVHVRPDAPALRFFRRERSRHLRRERELTKYRDLPAVTQDGIEITLHANIDLPQEIELAKERGARGIGMFRTEFLFLGYRLPSEDEQYQAYTQLVEAMSPDPVVIRTVDLGGDKLTHAVDSLPEANPYLGWRGIRICLDTPEMFRTQLRAILRASALGDARIMLPMITNLEEVHRARAFIAETEAELEREGVPYRRGCQVGIMIEVPSAAITCEQLAGEVDFFSLGTNDLVQYTLAVDRGTASVANLYDPLHPAVLRLICQVAQCAESASIPASICGEMASDPVVAPILLGLGINSLSVSTGAIPAVKEVVRGIELARAREIAKAALQLSSGAQVRKLVERELAQALAFVLPARREGEIR